MSPLDVPETPCTIPVAVVCPKCKQKLVLEMEITASHVATTDMDGVVEAALKPKVRVQSIAHLCNQTVLPFRGDVS